MSERVNEEINLLRGWFRDRLDYKTEGQWVKIRDYCIPADIWTAHVVDVVFQIPEGLPGQAPYAFHVSPPVTLLSGQVINNYTAPTSNPWGDTWGTFSWTLEVWQPAAKACEGSNMLGFARSIADRFRQGA